MHCSMQEKEAQETDNNKKEYTPPLIKLMKLEILGGIQVGSDGGDPETGAS